MSFQVYFIDSEIEKLKPQLEQMHAASKKFALAKRCKRPIDQDFTVTKMKFFYLNL
ncbi:unknown protein [Simkania negevensis Z]|uniref:Uncharacterized protein n=1 Tax=Simkania negevensis (strain ATCC VR-1471 / DSM 27360 / Z) TaxID=331113 RepID=F8L928_SIMNZ|nr:unknown protein [Simkania negevensis Z]